MGIWSPFWPRFWAVLLPSGGTCVSWPCFRSPSRSLAGACLSCVVCIVGTLGPGGCVRDLCRILIFWTLGPHGCLPFTYEIACLWSPAGEIALGSTVKCCLLGLRQAVGECEAESARLGLTEPEGFGETRVERTRPMHSHEKLTFETTVSKVSLSCREGKN
jgi:hypothetical protein